MKNAGGAYLLHESITRPVFLRWSFHLYRNGADNAVLLLVIFWMQDGDACYYLAYPEEGKTDHQPGDAETACYDGVRLCGSAACNGEVDHAGEHQNIEDGTQTGGQYGAEETALFDSGEGNDADEAGHAIEQEGADIGDQRDLCQVIDA